MCSIFAMAGLQDSLNEHSILAGISVDKVKHLVENVNLRHAAFQRHAANSTSSSPELRDCMQFSAHERPAVEHKHLFSREGSQWNQHTHSSLKSADVPTPLMHSKNRSRNKEKELFFAASDLCQYLNGGVNYRVMCLRYQRALDLLITLFREEMLMVSKLDLVPYGATERIHNIFSSFLQETKEILVENNILPPCSDEDVKKGAKRKSASGSHVLPVPLPITVPRAASSTNQADLFSNSKQTIHSNRSKATTELDVYEDREVHASPHFESNPVSHFAGASGGHKCVAATAVQERSMDRESHNLFTNVLRHPYQAKKRRSTDKSSVETLLSEERYAHKEDTYLIDSKARLKDLEEFYNQRYPYEGLKMMTDAMRLTFENEFKDSEKTGRETFANFKNRFDEQVLPCVWSYEAFNAYTMDNSTICSEYVKHCLQNNVKPNNKLLSQLGSVLPTGEITSIVLPRALLHDNDVKPLAAVLPRLQRLRFLNVEYNLIHDEGISAICDSLDRHPTLEVLDISGNPISDVGGHKLIRLATTAQELTRINQDSLSLSKSVQEALNEQLRLNEQNSESAREAVQQPLHGLLGSRGASLKSGHAPPRLAPLEVGSRKSKPVRKSSLNSMDLPSTKSNREATPEKTRSAKRTCYVSRQMELCTRVRLPYLTAGRGSRMSPLRGSASHRNVSLQNERSQGAK